MDASISTTSSGSPTAEPSPEETLSWPPILSAALGAWLVVSVFVWPHDVAAMLNTLVCGVVALGVALMTLRRPRARYANVAVGVWLFFTPYTLRPPALETSWNAIFVGILLIGASIVPTRPLELRELRELLRRPATA